MATYVNLDGALVEVPRMLKKPGARKVVQTEAELRAALDDGWLIKLPVAPNVEPDPADAPPAEVADADASDAEEPAKRKAGRPKKSDAS